MRFRQLGKNGPQVSALGLGCMGLSSGYGAPDPEEAWQTLTMALDLGLNFLDTAEAYGPYHNEELVGKAIRSRREGLVIATKLGFELNEAGIQGLNSRPDHLRGAVEGCLRRLQVDTIDLLYQHRVDPQVPIEDVVGAMSEMVAQGKVRYLGLSEAGPATLRRACAVHQIQALQSEYSLFERGVEAQVLPACRELGVALVPFSPLGRGLLTGQLPSEFAERDFRRTLPRFSGDPLQANLALAQAVKELAQRKGASPAQVALAWLLAQGEDIIPIPGTKRRSYLKDNLGALGLTLEAQDLAWLDQHLPPGAARGERYGAQALAWLDP